MNTDKESNVSLRIASKELDCAQISKILDLRPTSQFGKGQPLVKSNPNKLREENFWIYDLDLGEKIRLEEQVQTLINMILKRKGAFKKLEKCNVDIFCGYTTYNGQGGITLEAKLMNKFAALNIDLIVEFYCLENK